MIKRGFTLIESIVFIVVISIGLTGVMSLVLQLIDHNAEPLMESQAASIAMSYMEEILGQSFYDPSTGLVCPAPPVGRINFNNICDYQGYFNNASVSSITGTTFPNLAGYTVSATITYPATFATIPGADVIQITVTVHHTEIPDVILVAYRTPY